jgi:hypothetical protein
VVLVAGSGLIAATALTDPYRNAHGDTHGHREERGMEDLQSRPQVSRRTLHHLLEGKNGGKGTLQLPQEHQSSRLNRPSVCRLRKPASPHPVLGDSRSSARAES